MHASVMRWCEVLASGMRFGPHAIEVGSYDENGSVRPLFEPLVQSYIGVDMRPGPGVDEVLDATDLLVRYGRRSFDLVISTEMLEHAVDWSFALFNLKQLVTSGGYLILTTRGPGFPHHAHPDDHWRFTTALMAKACADMRLTQVGEDTDPASPGVFVLALGPSRIREFAEDPSYWLEAEPAP